MSRHGARCRCCHRSVSPCRSPSEVGRRRGARGSGPFPTAPSRTGRARFPGIRLSSDHFRSGCGGTSRVDVFMAAAADHEGLAPSHRHQMDPRGPLTASGPVEISELADVVDLKVRPCLADLAALGEEPAEVSPSTTGKPHQHVLQTVAGYQRITAVAAHHRIWQHAPWLPQIPPALRQGSGHSPGHRRSSSNFRIATRVAADTPRIRRTGTPLMGRQRSARSPFGRLRGIGLSGQHAVTLPRSVLPAHAITASPLRFECSYFSPISLHSLDAE